MATPLPTPPTTTTTTTTTIASSFVRSVFLHDWWLVKANSRALAVGGFAFRESQGVRAFCSAAIAKRHDTTTLETVDGITITISGLINRSRTHQNGFPSEICNHFLFGFPYYWDTFAAQSIGEESSNRGVSSRTSSFDEFNISPDSSVKNFLPASLYDLPVTRIRDLLMSSVGDSENCSLTRNIFNDILGKFSGNAAKNTVVPIHSSMESGGPPAGDSVWNETPVNRKKAKVTQKHKDDDDILDVTKTRAEEFEQIIYQSKMSVDVATPTKGVSTRSMTRLSTSRNKQGISDQSSSPDAVGKQCPRMMSRSVSSVRRSTILSGEENPVMEFCDKSAIRRSSNRLKNLKK